MSPTNKYKIDFEEMTNPNTPRIPNPCITAINTATNKNPILKAAIIQKAEKNSGKW